jgi:restriction endonuclease Mrr
MALLLRAHVIVMTTTGRFASSVQDYARQMTQTTSLQVVLIDGKTLTEFMEKGPTALMNFFHEEASTTMRLKRAQVNDMSLDDA